MTRRTRTVVSMAAGIVLGCGVTMAQNNGGVGRAPGESNAGDNSPMQPAQGAQPARTGQEEKLDTGARMGGQMTDREILRQIRQFAQDPATATDKLFVLNAGVGNQCEIDLARQAQHKATNEQVKQLAQNIMQDHQQAQQQLQQVAQQLGVQIPSELPEIKQQEVQILNALPTDQFEKQFVCRMEADHAKDLIEYRAVAQTAQNDQVKQYAQQILPKLAMHYDRTQQTAVALGLPSGGPEAIPAAGRIEGTPGTGGNMGDMKTPSQSGGR